MKLITDECYSKMPKAPYGFDAYDNPVECLDGYTLLDRLTFLEKGDIPFDVYSGWLKNTFNPRYHIQAISSGRWTAWARIT